MKPELTDEAVRGTTMMLAALGGYVVYARQVELNDYVSELLRVRDRLEAAANGVRGNRSFGCLMTWDDYRLVFAAGLRTLLEELEST